MLEAQTLEQIGWLSVLLLGISVGFTTCTAVCMPYLGSWALSRGEGSGKALVDTGLFAAGKITAYATLGGVAGLLGKTIIDLLNGGLGHYLIGAASIGAGLWLIWPRKSHARCGFGQSAGRYSPFMLGYALTFTPCAPLAALIAASAASGDVLLGIAYGFAFGLGAALTPLFIVIPLIGSFGRRLQEGRPWLGRWLKLGGGTVLVLIGLRRILIAM